MRTFKEEDAITKICPFMSGENLCNCVASRCIFWSKTIKVGNVFKECGERSEVLVIYNGEESIKQSEGYCGMVHKNERNGNG